MPRTRGGRDSSGQPDFIHIYSNPAKNKEQTARKKQKSVFYSTALPASGKESSLSSQTDEHFFIHGKRSPGQTAACHPDNGNRAFDPSLLAAECFPHPPFDPVPEHRMSEPLSHSRSQLTASSRRGKDIEDTIGVHYAFPFFMDFLELFVLFDPHLPGISISYGICLLFQTVWHLPH